MIAPAKPREASLADEFADARVQDGLAAVAAAGRAATAMAAVRAALGEDEFARRLRGGDKLSLGRRQLRVRGWPDLPPAALRAFAAADVHYWSIVQRHDRLIRQLARQHARRSGVEFDIAHGVAVEAAYTAAVLWEPERGGYTNALSWYVMSFWQRCNDRQSDLNVANTRAGRRGRFGFVPTVSIHGDDEDACVSGLPAIQPFDAAGEHPLDVDRLRAAVAQLDPRDRRVVEGWMEGLDYLTLGEELGVSKERVRQILVRGVRDLRLLLAPHVGHDRVVIPPSDIVSRRPRRRRGAAAADNDPAAAPAGAALAHPPDEAP